MIWYLIGAISITFALLVLLPWRAEICLSAETGFFFRLKAGMLIPVINGHKTWGKRSAKNIFTLKHLDDVLNEANFDTLKKITRYFHALAGHTNMNLEISGEFGFGDPALTGVVYGMACSLVGVWGIRQADLSPNFLHPVLRGEIRLSGTFVPLVVIVTTAATAFHPSVRRVLLALAGFGRGEKSEEV